MTAEMVCRCEVNMTKEEQEMFNSILFWFENLEGVSNMPEGVQEMLHDIYDNISDLLSLIPENDRVSYD